MSFLSELMAKKAKLKPTITLETYADGSQRRVDCAQGFCLENIDRSASTSKYGFVIDTKPDTVPACVIDDFLYLGSQDSFNESNIELFNLTDIVSVGIKTPPIHRLDRSVHFHHIPCLDLPDTDMKAVIDTAETIFNEVKRREPPGRILVHCNAGVSRSATICIAHLMITEELTFEAAYKHVKKKRECIRPNDGFIQQLKAMEIMKTI